MNAPNPHHHWTVNSCFGVFLSVRVHFGIVLLLHETWCKTRQTSAINARVRAMMSCQNFFATNALDRHHWTLNSCFGAFLSVRVHFGPFRYYAKLGAKWANLVQLMQKFMPRCLLTIFRNKSSRSTPLEPKLMFCCVSFYLGAFETIWLQHKTRCKMGQPGTIKAKVCATKSCQNFLKPTHPIHTIGP